MSRALVRAVAVGLAGMAGAGCSALDSGSVVSAQGSSGNGASGSSSSGRDGGAEASGDASAADGGSDDGGAEASGDWCDTQPALHLFCEDFDQGVPGKLTSKTYGGGLVAADVSNVVSGTESMWASTPPLHPAAFASALGTASFMKPSSHPRLQAELQVASDCVATQDGVTLATLTFEAYSVMLVATAGGTRLVEQVSAADGGVAGSAAYPLTSPIPSDVWSVVVLDIDLSARRATVTLSGTAVLTSQALSLAPELAPPMATVLSVGAEIQNDLDQSPGCRVRVDNVLFDLL
jgi:hypothetical protein